MKSSAATVGTRAKKRRKAIILLFITVIVLAVGLFQYIRLFGPTAVEAGAPESIQLVIPMGSTSSQIGKALMENGIIRSDIAFRILTRLKGYGPRYKAGFYMLSTGMDLQDVMEEITKGSIHKETVRFTIPEGYELRQIADLLHGEGIVNRDEFLKEAEEGVFKNKFISSIPERENRLEGYLFPDTYEVFVGESAHSIINRMLGKFEEVAGEIGLLKGEMAGMTLDEVVTLASVVEREAGTKKELPLVSSVFHNRLRLGIRLGSCATVQYVLKERKPRLSLEDTHIDSPYNTYIVPGLPIGPIASPGEEALRAAVEPADSDYLYFVATNKGTNVFSDTYQQFLIDKETYR